MFLKNQLTCESLVFKKFLKGFSNVVKNKKERKIIPENQTEPLVADTKDVQVSDAIYKDQSKVLDEEYEDSRNEPTTQSLESTPEGINDLEFTKTSDPEFQDILNELKANFKPREVANEEHLQAQITLHLRMKFQDKRIMRGSIIEDSRPDFVINDKFALEVKVPQSTEVLESMVNRLTRYRHTFPHVCSIIVDDENLNMTQTILEYARLFRKYDIQIIIIKGKMKV